MKQNDDDLAFAREFALQLRPKYKEASKNARVDKPEKGKVEFDEEFAGSLDVSRAALWKYLHSPKPPTPSIRTIVLAYKRYKIAVRYAGIETKEILRKGRRSRKTPEGQMDLPFSIRASGPDTVALKLEPKGVNRQEWRLRITAS